MQYPIGAEDNFEGVIDLIEMKALRFSGSEGQNVDEGEIPDELLEDCKAQRAHMLEQLSMYNDEMMELLLSEEEVPLEMIYKVTRDAVLGGATPVYMGSAFKNKAVQPLLDAVVRYLPSPLDRDVKGTDPKDEEKKIELKPDPKAPFVGMAFKIVDDPFGQLTFMRIYQGTIEKGGTYVNQRTGRSERFSRIVRMHSDKREEIDNAARPVTSSPSWASTVPVVIPTPRREISARWNRCSYPIPSSRSPCRPRVVAMATRWARRCNDSVKKTRRSASPPMRKPTRS